MMNHWIKIKNAAPVATDDIPMTSVHVFRDSVLDLTQKGMRPIHFFGRLNDDGKAIILTAVMGDDASHSLWLSSARILKGGHYNAITSEAASFHLFERELYEQTGILPKGHPWLKPVRFKKGGPQALYQYPFLKSKDDEIHEIGVGPIHAGIIEPGHFRFICHGEDVLHLEIQLGFQHRGVEKLFIQKKAFSLSSLAESIVGDTVIGHTWTHVSAIEALCNTAPLPRAETIRAIALELERIAVHLAGLGGTAEDMGFLPGASVYGRIRTAIINSTLLLCGNRFGRGLIRPGGVVFDIEMELKRHILKTFDEIDHDLEKINHFLFNSPSVLSRLEGTGVVSRETARRIGLVGLMARSAGLPIDARADQPHGVYKEENFKPLVMNTGDAHARAMLRAYEIGQSMDLIRKWFDCGIPEGDMKRKPSPLIPNSAAVAVVEGWRGEISHMVFTDEKGNIGYYKIVDPSFHNWIGLALAIKGNGISDFPLCNKGFDLSYCGHDL